MKKQGRVDLKFKRAVKDSLRRHAWNMGVSDYVVDILYMEDDKKPVRDGMHTLAEIIVDRRYLKATLSIYPLTEKRWRELGNHQLEDVIAHEVAHIATQEMFDVATATYREEGEMHDAWERLTERFSRISMKLDAELRHIKLP